MELTAIAAIVTGGASGLGAATARELARRGARVVIADIADDKGKAVATSIDGAFAHVDVTSTDDIIAATELAKTLGPVRALVNCAGTGLAARTVGRGGYETAHDLNAFRRILEINTIGTFDCIRIVATAMAGGGPITGVPSTATPPAVGANNPAMHLSSVVLPAPEGPTMQTSSPSPTLKVTSRMASTVRLASS